MTAHADKHHDAGCLPDKSHNDHLLRCFLVRIPAWIFLGAWFLYQLIEANFGLFNAHANAGGVAFFAHVGGFVFGLLTARLLARAGQAAPRKQWPSTA